MLDTCDVDRRRGKASMTGQSATVAVAMERDGAGEDGKFLKNDLSLERFIRSVPISMVL